MSKIYNKYLKLKEENSNQLYLFHSGKFYIFIDEDADFINQYVVLKKTKFTNEVLKCGFPDNRLEDYLRVFSNHGLNISIIESDAIDLESIPTSLEKKIQKYKKIEGYLENIEIDTITPVEALVILNQIVGCIRG